VRPVTNGDGGHRSGFAGVEQRSAVGDEIGLMLGQASAELDDRLAELDRALSADVLARTGTTG
jgi:hypothetical protein